MTLFGVPIWRWILIIVLIIIVVKRANIVALFAKYKYSKGDYFGALKIFNVADKIGNLNLGNKILYGYNCLRCGELDAARKAFNLADNLARPKTADKYRIKSLKALLAWKEDDIETAVELLEEVYEDDYKTTTIYQNLGIMYNLAGEYEKALEFNLEAYDYNSDDNIIVDNLAESYALTGDLKKAAEVYEELLSRDPEPRFPEAYYGYGEVLIELGEKEKGIELIEKSLTKPFSFLSIKSKEEIENLYSELKSK